MRTFLLISLIALGISAAHAQPITHEEPPRHASGKTDNPHWVPGYGDNRSCHGACLTAPFWSKLFGFIAYLNHRI